MSHRRSVGSERLSDAKKLLDRYGRQTLPLTLILGSLALLGLLTFLPRALVAETRVPVPPQHLDRPDLLRAGATAELDAALPGGRDPARSAPVEPVVPGNLPKTYPDPDGGDDVEAFVTETVLETSLAAADNGDLYLASTVWDPIDQDWDIQILRSIDEGLTWQAWGFLEDSVPTTSYRHPVIIVPGGANEACYVAYTVTDTQGPSRIYLSKSPVGGSSASFSSVSAFYDPAVSFDYVDLVTDVVDHTAYWIYLVAQGDDTNGTDIWFTRSTNLGMSCETPYRIAQLILNDRNYERPRVDYGKGSRIHVAWQFRIVDAGDTAARYRNADNYANGGISAWNPIVYLTSNSNGVHEDKVTVRASNVDDTVVYYYRRSSLSWLLDYGYLEVSHDRGTTWGAESPHVFDPSSCTEVLELPGGGWAVVNDDDFQVATRWAPADLTFWTVYRDLADRSYYDGAGDPRVACATTAAHPDDIAVAWSERVASPASDPDRIWFDATWRDDPGYPNLEPDFPKPLSSPPQNDPAVIDFDHDGDLEIVFGDEAGYIQVLHHDGTSMAGWPQYVGSMDDQAAVAVGDLNGDGDFEVVAGNRSGQVFSFSAAGDLTPNWPLDLGTADAVFVSIGAIRPPYPRDVVACSSNQLWLINYRAAIQSGFPWTFAGHFRAPAAIGDVDDDGQNEIVTLKDGWIHVNGPTSPTPEAYRSLPGVIFDAPPSLGDIEMTGKRQIVAPTSTGTVYVMNEDLSDRPGWPFTDPGGYRVSSVALANIIGSWELSLAFATQNYTVHHLWWDGEEAIGWPHSTQTGWWLYGSPIIENTDGGSPDILIGSRDQFGYSWDNAVTANPEWPKALGGPCEITPAAGDLDNDGRMEVVFLTRQTIAVLDVGQYTPPWDGQRGRWPMYMNNPQRTGCIDCDLQLATASPTITSIAFRPPAPNPSPGSTEFHYALMERSKVRLDLYDVRGRRVRELVDLQQEPGWQRVRWDGRDDHGQPVASGAYFARLQVQDSRGSTGLTQRVLLLR